MTDLSGDDYKEGNEERDMPPVKDLDNGNNVNGIDSASTGVGKDSDENMLLDIEGTGVEGELVGGAWEEDAVRNFGSHEATQWDHRDLGGDSSNGERLSAIPEELVQE